MFCLYLCMCAGNSKSCRRILMKFLEGWTVCLASNSSILDFDGICFAMQIKGFFKRNYYHCGIAQFTNLADNSRSCRRFLTKFFFEGRDVSLAKRPILVLIRPRPGSRNFSGIFTICGHGVRIFFVQLRK